MKGRKRYVVEAERYGRWWIATGTGELEGVSARARSVAKLEPRLRRAIALHKQMPEDSFDVVARPKGADDLDAFIDRRTRANPAFPRLVKEALEGGRSVRDRGRCHPNGSRVR